MKAPKQPRDEVFMLGAVVMLVVVVLLATGVYGAWIAIVERIQ